MACAMLSNMYTKYILKLIVENTLPGFSFSTLIGLYDFLLFSRCVAVFCVFIYVVLMPGEAGG